MSRLLSSDQIIKTLLHFGFKLVSQRGSHQKYQKEGFTVIVPSPRKEIPIGTFRSIVRQSGLSINDYTEKIKNRLQEKLAVWEPFEATTLNSFGHATVNVKPSPVNSTLFVTGAAGFIASRVCQMLLDQGNQVIGIDNMNDYYDVRLKEYRLARLTKYPRFTFYMADIENREELKPIFEAHAFRSVFNLAARAGVRYSMENPWVYLRTNTEGTLNLLELMKDFGVPKFILASTSSLYAGLPMPFTEDLPVNTPISPYAASKKAAEAFAYTYHRQYGIDVSILRYFTVFGPGGRPDMAPYRFVKWILEGTPISLYGDGSAARDFTFVDDIARGTILAEKPLGYQIINLGGGNKPVTINQFILWIEELTGKKAAINYLPTHSADMDFTMANIDKARQLLGWEPTVDTYAGLKEMLKDTALLKYKV